MLNTCNLLDVPTWMLINLYFIYLFPKSPVHVYLVNMNLSTLVWYICANVYFEYLNQLLLKVMLWFVSILDLHTSSIHSWFKHFTNWATLIGELFNSKYSQSGFVKFRIHTTEVLNIGLKIIILNNISKWWLSHTT